MNKTLIAIILIVICILCDTKPTPKTKLIDAISSGSKLTKADAGREL